MHALSPHELIGIWEAGLHQRPVERAMSILKPALPHISHEELLNLTIGNRDSHLLNVRQQLFGETIQGYAECPKCAEQLEFSIKIADISENSDTHTSNQFKCEKDNYQIEFRLPTSMDFMAAASSQDIPTARAIIFKRCLMSARQNGNVINTDDHHQALGKILATEIADRDPQADVELKLHCSQCQHDWRVDLDIAGYLWAEIDDKARHLLDEVHVLASVYGWHETDILSMSNTRRRFYLEKVQ